MNKKINIPTGLKKTAMEGLSRRVASLKNTVAAEVILVDPDECYVVENPRKKMDPKLVEIYTSEFLDPRQGQREACTAYPKDEKGYRIQHGATRTLAGKKAREINPDWKLKIIVDPALNQRTEFENYWERGTNNINRDNMNFFDIADWFHDSIEKAKLEGITLTQSDIAQKLAMNKSQVSRIYSLRNAPDYVKKLLEDGRTEDLEVLANLVKISQTSPELAHALIDTTDLDRKTVREALKHGELPSKPSSDSEPTNIAPVDAVPDSLQPAESRPDDRNEADESSAAVAHAQQLPEPEKEHDGNNVHGSEELPTDDTPVSSEMTDKVEQKSSGDVVHEEEQSLGQTSLQSKNVAQSVTISASIYGLYKEQKCRLVSVIDESSAELNILKVRAHVQKMVIIETEHGELMLVKPDSFTLTAVTFPVLPE